MLGRWKEGIFGGKKGRGRGGKFMHEGREEREKENSKEVQEILLKITSTLNHTKCNKVHRSESSRQPSVVLGKQH